MKVIVPYNKLYSHMEVLFNNESIYFRALLFPDSYAVVSSYNIEKKISPHGVMYLLTLYAVKGNIKPIKEIEYKERGGIQITIPRNEINMLSCTFYYKDPTGIYPITIGNEKSWQDYLNMVSIEKLIKK